MKKLLSIILAVLSALTLSIFATGCTNNITVSVLQYAEHGSLDNCYNGIVEGLKEKGYSNVKVNLLNPKGIDADNQAYAKSIIDDVPSVAVGIATPSAYALAAAADKTGIPVVFSAVSDPVASGFKDFSNVTGTSDKLPVDSQIDLIKQFLGSTKTLKIGIIYTKTETNSIAQIAEFEALEATKNIEIVSYGVDDATQIPTACDAILEEVDCLNNLTDNTVVQNLTTVLDKANAKNIPVFGSEIEQVKKGCLASCSLDYYKLGIKTGYIVAQILDGTPASEIDYLYLNTEYSVDYNSAVLNRLNLTLPSQLTASDVNA